MEETFSDRASVDFEGHASILNTEAEIDAAIISILNNNDGNISLTQTKASFYNSTLAADSSDEDGHTHNSEQEESEDIVVENEYALMSEEYEEFGDFVDGSDNRDAGEGFEIVAEISDKLAISTTETDHSSANGSALAIPSVAPLSKGDDLISYNMCISLSLS
jgi:hypothetical protein